MTDTKVHDQKSVVPAGYTVTAMTIPAADWHSDEVPPIGTAFGFKSYLGVDDQTFQQMLTETGWAEHQRVNQDEFEAALNQVPGRKRDAKVQAPETHGHQQRA